MILLNFTKKILTTLILLSLVSILYSCGIYRPSDARIVSPNADERVKKNIEEGKGVKLFDKRNNSGLGGFASANPVWRASLDTLDFMILSSADYGGGIIITDWYSEGNNNESSKNSK